MSTLVAQTISNGTVSTSSANVIQGSAKAWVNFNGTTGSIRASYNASSVTRNGTGDYTVNFTNAFANTDYAVLGTAGVVISGGTMTPVVCINNNAAAPTTSAVRMAVYQGSTSIAYDPTLFCVSVFR